MPVETLVVVQSVSGFGGLLGVQGCQKIVGGRGHLFRDQACVSGGVRSGRHNGQLEKENEGEIKDLEIEMTKERQVILPRANRLFEKVPPRPKG